MALPSRSQSVPLAPYLIANKAILNDA